MCFTFLRTATTTAFEDLVEVGKIAMIVTIGAATLALDTTCTSLLPFVVKHSVANLLLLLCFVRLTRVTIVDGIDSVLYWNCSVLRRSFRCYWRCSLGNLFFLFGSWCGSTLRYSDALRCDFRLGDSLDCSLRSIAELKIRSHKRRRCTKHHRQHESSTEKPLPPVSRLRFNFLQRHDAPRGKDGPLVIKMGL